MRPGNTGGGKGLGPTDVWLKYCGTAGKPGRKRRKQTSTCSIGRNRSTRLFKHFLPPLINFCDCPALGENLEEINVIIVLFDFLPSSGYEIWFWVYYSRIKYGCKNFFSVYLINFSATSYFTVKGEPSWTTQFLLSKGSAPGLIKMAYK